MTDDAVRGVQGTRASDEDEDDDDGFEKIASSVGARARARWTMGTSRREGWVNVVGWWWEITITSLERRGTTGGGRAIARVSIRFDSIRFVDVSCRRGD